MLKIHFVIKYDKLCMELIGVLVTKENCVTKFLDGTEYLCSQQKFRKIESD